MKNSIYKFLVLSFALVLYTSCKKNEPRELLPYTILQGQLLDAYTREPINNGKVFLTDGQSYDLVDSFTVGIDGEYLFKYDHHEYPYTMTHSSAGQYLSNANISRWAAEYLAPGATPRRSVKNDGAINNLDILLPPIGWVKYHFKNVNNLEGSFEIRFSPYDSWGVVSWSGLNLDRTYTSIYPSGVDFEIGYAILRNGALYKQHYDTLFIPHKDTLTYYVEF